MGKAGSEREIRELIRGALFWQLPDWQREQILEPLLTKRQREKLREVSAGNGKEIPSERIILISDRAKLGGVRGRGRRRGRARYGTEANTGVSVGTGISEELEIQIGVEIQGYLRERLTKLQLRIYNLRKGYNGGRYYPDEGLTFRGIARKLRKSKSTIKTLYYRSERALSTDCGFLELKSRCYSKIGIEV